MADQVEIYNMALLVLGEPVASDPEETDPSVIKMNAMFPSARDETMRLHPWNSCMELAQLAAQGSGPAFGFANRFKLPTDPFCLRAWKLDDDTIKWKVLGREIHTDAGGPLNLEFISRKIDISSWDALLAHAVAMRLAAKVAFSITNKRLKEEAAVKAFQVALIEARSPDGQEGTPDLIVADDFVKSRL